MTSRRRERRRQRAATSVKRRRSGGGLYTLAALDMRGEDVDLSYAAGKVSLVTNVASE